MTRRPGPDDADAGAYQRMHETVVTKFVRTPGSGLERMSKTRGFVAARVPSVESIELVGVALHDSPVAYVDDNETTRPLNAIEHDLLKRLGSGEELAIEGATALGAIRARPDCRRCHLGRAVGDLLGAFAYRLR